MVTVQWPPDAGREDDVQTTYGPWHVVRDACWKQTLTEQATSSVDSCTYGGHYVREYQQKIIRKTYLQPIPASLPALTPLKGPQRLVSSFDNCNPPPSNPYTSSGGGGGSSSDDDDNSWRTSRDGHSGWGMPGYEPAATNRHGNPMWEPVSNLNSRPSGDAGDKVPPRGRR